MTKDKLIKLVSVGDKNGVGKGHTYLTRKNNRKHASVKFEFKKFNPIARTHTIYKEKKV
jgi:ribosomal protein L33